VALTGYNRDGRASFRIMINPLVSWLWFGGYVVGIGVLLAVWPHRRRRMSEVAEGGRP
jgi:cytochrome c-type biogenesis protein CcmF